MIASIEAARRAANAFMDAEIRRRAEIEEATARHAKACAEWTRIVRAIECALERAEKELQRLSGGFRMWVTMSVVLSPDRENFTFPVTLQSRQQHSTSRTVSVPLAALACQNVSTAIVATVIDAFKDYL